METGLGYLTLAGVGNLLKKTAGMTESHYILEPARPNPYLS